MIVISVSWKDITNAFFKKYDEFFLVPTSKAYLDLIDAVIDGAKEKCADSMTMTTSEDNRRRRKFNQYSILKQIVIQLCSKSLIDYIQDPSYFDHSPGMLTESCHVKDMAIEWTNNLELNKFLHNKSKSCKHGKRYEELVETYKNYHMLATQGIASVIQMAINRLYYQHFIGHKYKLPTREASFECVSYDEYAREGAKRHMFRSSIGNTCLTLLHQWEELDGTTTNSSSSFDCTMAVEE